jgi:Flp pilus assembly protein TadD
MKNIFALLSVSTLLFQVLTVERVSAQAALQIQQIAQADLSSAEAYMDRDRSKSAAGDQQGAIADFDRSIEINPYDPSAYSARAVAKYKLNDKRGALNDARIATNLHRLRGNTAEYQDGLDAIRNLEKLINEGL